MLRKKLLLDVDQRDGNKSEYVIFKKPRMNNVSSECLDLSYNNCDQGERSKYFPNVSSDSEFNSICQEMINLQRCFNKELKKISFSKDPIRYIYNPTTYAAEPCEKYLQLYCNTKKKIIFLGMNPGPWGMCQTGIPFGDVTSVLNWLQIEGKVTQPEEVCSERQIQGFSCKRKEISGDRFWNFFKKLCKTPDSFFKNSIVYNYCPLAFMKKDGGNITPPEIETSLKNALEEACDKNLLKIITLLKPEFIVCIGRYAEKRATVALKQISADIKILYLTHPSPRSAQSNNWPEKANSKMYNELTQCEISPKKIKLDNPKEQSMAAVCGSLKIEEKTFSEIEQKYMEKAFQLANEALQSNEVPVGCIFIFDDNIIAIGRNMVNETRNATRHAEMCCIDQVNDFCKIKKLSVVEVFRQIDVYVTVEPCIMCAAALYDLKVKSIIFGCKNDRFGGETVFNVANVLNPVTERKGGYRADDAMNLLKLFYQGVNPSAPPSKVKARVKKVPHQKN